MKMILVYKTDNAHSFASRDIIGVATSKTIAIDICKQQATKEGVNISDNQLWSLENLKQTQGYEGNGEFHYEEVDTNILL